MARPRGRKLAAVTLGTRVTPELHRRYIHYREALAATMIRQFEPTPSDVLRRLIELGLEAEERRLAAEAAAPPRAAEARAA